MNCTSTHRHIDRKNGEVEKNLEVDDDGKDEDRSKQVHQVWQVLAIESLTQATDFILTSSEQVKQGNHCPLKLRS